MELSVINRNIVLFILISLFSVSSVVNASDTVYIGDNALVRVVYLEATYTSKDLGVCGVTYVRVGMDTGTKIKLPKGYPMPEPQVIVEQSKLAKEYITNATATVLGLSKEEFRVKLVHDGRTIYVAVIIPESRNVLVDKSVGYKYLEKIQELQRMLGLVLVIYVYPVPDQLYNADLETVKKDAAEFFDTLSKGSSMWRMMKNGTELNGPPEALEMVQALRSMGQSYVMSWYSREPPYAVYIDIAVHNINDVKLEDIKRFVKAVRSAIGCRPPLDIAIFEGWYVFSFTPQSDDISTPAQENILVRMMQEEPDTGAGSLGEAALPGIQKEVVSTPRPANSSDSMDHSTPSNPGLTEDANSGGGMDDKAWDMMAGGMVLLVAAVLVVAVLAIAERR